MMLAVAIILAEIPAAWVIGMWAINLAVSIALGVGMFFLNTRTRRIETLEEKYDKKVEALVEARMNIRSTELAGSMKELSGEIRRINERLNSGDGELRELIKADHLGELKAVSGMADLREWVMGNAATKEEVGELSVRVDKLHQLLSEGLINRIENAARSVERASERAGRK